MKSMCIFWKQNDNAWSQNIPREIDQIRPPKIKRRILVQRFASAHQADWPLLLLIFFPKRKVKYLEKTANDEITQIKFEKK